MPPKYSMFCKIFNHPNLCHHLQPPQCLPSSTTFPTTAIIYNLPNLCHHLHPLPSSTTSPTFAIIYNLPNLCHHLQPPQRLPSSTTSPTSAIIYNLPNHCHHLQPPQPLPSSTTSPTTQLPIFFLSSCVVLLLPFFNQWPHAHEQHWIHRMAQSVVPPIPHIYNHKIIVM